jgi:hypothetical protein
MEPKVENIGSKPGTTDKGEPGLTIYCRRCDHVIGTYGGDEIQKHIRTQHRYSCAVCSPKAKA